MDECILKIKGLVDSLLVVGHVIIDADLILYILGGLGNDYEVVVINLTSRENVTMQEVQFML